MRRLVGGIPSGAQHTFISPARRGFGTERVRRPQLRENSMRFRITIRDENDQPQTYTGIGDPAALEAAAYDNGAMGVTVIVE